MHIIRGYFKQDLVIDLNMYMFTNMQTYKVSEYPVSLVLSKRMDEI